MSAEHCDDRLDDDANSPWLKLVADALRLNSIPEPIHSYQPRSPSIAADRDYFREPRYPYPERLGLIDYLMTNYQLQVELVKLQNWIQTQSIRMLLLFEGRDTAGKGSTIKALVQNLNPRWFKVVALNNPTDQERGQWYLQRYSALLPSAGEMRLFDLAIRRILIFERKSPILLIGIEVVCNSPYFGITFHPKLLAKATPTWFRCRKSHTKKRVKRVISVVIADDHQIIRDGLRAYLEPEADIAVLADTADGWETLQQVKELQPDVVLMDIAMPGLNGIDATRRICALDVSTRVLALSSHNSEQHIRKMLTAGASGYLIKECAGDELVRAIRTLHAGQLYVSPAITGTLVANFLDQTHNSEVSAQGFLTGREREVLQLISEGHSTAHTAERLSLSVKTIESHRSKIMNKLDIRTIAGLTKYAIRNGLTSIES